MGTRTSPTAQQEPAVRQLAAVLVSVVGVTGLFQYRSVQRLGGKDEAAGGSDFVGKVEIEEWSIAVDGQHDRITEHGASLRPDAHTGPLRLQIVDLGSFVDGHVAGGQQRLSEHSGIHGHVVGITQGGAKTTLQRVAGVEPDIEAILVQQRGRFLQRLCLGVFYGQRETAGLFDRHLQPCGGLDQPLSPFVRR